ncbi:MAG: hypothetical protein WCF84_02285 [Anaerolineae bacterium]
MADNITIPATGSGDNTPVVATDQVGTVHYQRVKLVDGTPDSSANIPGSAANGLTVDVTRVQGTVAVSASALPLPTGAATESTLSGIKGKTDNLPADPAREGGNLATLAAKDFALAGAAITGQSLEAGGSGVLGWLASLRKALTDRLPAALVGGRLDVNVGNTPTVNTGLSTNAGATDTTTLRVITASDGPLNTNLGATTDAAITSDANGSVSGKLRGLVKMLADAWDSVNHRLNVADANVAALTKNSGNVDATTLRVITAADGPLNTNLGTTTDAAVTSDANGSVSSKLRGLVKILADVWDSTNHLLAIKQPDTRATGQTLNSASSNAAVTVTLNNGEGVTAFAVSGLTASGATLTIEASDDGSNWAGVNGIAPSTGALFSTFTTDQQFRVNTGGRVGVRVRVSATGTGTITVSYNASAVSSAVALSSPLPAGSNAIGTVDTELPAAAALADAASNPTTPTIGADVSAYNGATWDRLRIPNVFKDLNAAAIGTIATVWTPTSGKKFRIMGGSISVSAAASVLLEDNSGGNTVFRTPKLLADTPYSFDLGNGFLSAAANNVLKATSSAAANVTGTLYGVEE